MNTRSGNGQPHGGENRVYEKAQHVLAAVGSDGTIAAGEYRQLAEEYLALSEKTQYAARTEGIREREREKLQSEKHLEALIAIGNALSIEKEQNKLLRTILALSRRITGADAGSVYLIIEQEPGEKVLRFEYSHTISRELPYETRVMPLDTNSIAGYTAVTGRVLNIPDVYELGENDPVQFNRYFDETWNYRSKSMLVVPMRNHYDEVIGVVQLLNCKDMRAYPDTTEPDDVKLGELSDFENKIIPFDRQYVYLVQAIASQAAIALENNRMMRQIERQFEQFAKASVKAVEAQDPPTSGHSFRVAEMCLNTARAVNRDDRTYGDTRFSENELKELHYAGLLHDFGKVHIESRIFKKAKKLFPRDYDNLLLRLTLLYRSEELRIASGAADAQSEHRLADLRSARDMVRTLNEPSLFDVDIEETLDTIEKIGKQFTVFDLDGTAVELLTAADIANLKIKRGTLNAAERRQMEGHVEHTYNFVSEIPWPDELRNIPAIARKHHEKLDGSGYPLGLKGTDENPIQARIMAIADLFDALAAADRPYKKAVPLEKCFAIMREEAAAGKIDADLVELFIRCEAYRLTENT